MLQATDCQHRLRELTHQMLLGFPSVRRWDQTDDILQESLIRLTRALAEVTPTSDLHFLRLAALQIRRVLLDLARSYSSGEHFAANHETWGEENDRRLAQEPLQGDDDALSLSDWSEFHLAVEALPPACREVFDLVWYMGLSQREAAQALGLTERSIQRRWREARLLLHRSLNDRSTTSQ